MKTKTYHASNMGNMLNLPVYSDPEGYVTYHDSPRYAKATDAHLLWWYEHGRQSAMRLGRKSVNGIWQRGEKMNYDVFDASI